MIKIKHMIEWVDEHRFTIGNVNFKAIDFGLENQESRLGEFVFEKPTWMVRRYEQLIKILRPKKIFELGIWKGGSCVFFQKLAEAEKLVAIDISEARISVLDQYIKENGLSNSLRPLYGVNQADREHLRKIVLQEFADGKIDLVIDDASHFLEETRHSFNVLFPFVRPGGVYVIEDWAWAHALVGDHTDDRPGLYPEREPLTKLIFEIVLACPSTHPFIEKIEIDRNSATIWRGEADIDPLSFDIAQCCLARGRALISRKMTFKKIAHNIRNVALSVIRKGK